MAFNANVESLDGKCDDTLYSFDITYQDQEHYKVKEHAGYNGEGSDRPVQARWVNADCGVLSALKRPVITK